MQDTAPWPERAAEPTTTHDATPRGPLCGLKVLELGQLIAGPFAAKTLADFGADVIKIEPPGSGDPLRQWRLVQDGTSVCCPRVGAGWCWPPGVRDSIGTTPGTVSVRPSGMGRGCSMPRAW